jgi:hypothetical protein
VAALVMGFEWDLEMDPRDVVPRGSVSIKPGKGLFLRLKAL